MSRSETSDGARRAGRAQLAYKRGHAGFYVINAFTRIPVAGPFNTPSKAEMEAMRLEPPTMRVVDQDGKGGLDG